MLCPQCGLELPDDARSCSHCRYNFSLETAPAISTDTATQERQVRKLLIGAFLLLVAVGGVVWVTMRASGAGWATALWSPHQAPEITLPIVASVQKIKSREYVSYAFVVPPGCKTARVDGNFAVSTRPSSAVEVLITDAAGFAGWKNHHPASVLYNSGRANQGSLNLPLSSAQTKYYLIVNNGVSPDPQDVQIDIRLHYRP